MVWLEMEGRPALFSLQLKLWVRKRDTKISYYLHD